MQPGDGWAAAFGVSGVVSVVAGVRADIKRITVLAPDMAKSSLALSALALAALIDDPGNSATSRSMCARELRETLVALAAACPEVREADGVDELAGRRAARIAKPDV